MYTNCKKIYILHFEVIVKTLLCVVCVVLLQDSETDDDTERRSRRSVCVEQQRLASVSESATPAKTIEQITNHFKMCQKLFNENVCLS